MRIKYKLLLIIALFFGLILFNKSDSLAYTYEGQEVPDLPENINNSEYIYIFSNAAGNLSLFYVDKPLLAYTHKDLVNDKKVIFFFGNDSHYLRYGLKKGATSWEVVSNKYFSSGYYTQVGYTSYPTLIYSNSPFYCTDYCSAPGHYLIDINDPLMQSFSANDNIENYYKCYLGKYEGQQIPFTSSLFYIAKENTLKSVLAEIVGLLPVAIIAIVAFISLRKGILFLRSILYSA